MKYVKEKDGTPNTVLTALIFKAAARHFKEKQGQHLSVRIAMDYRRDVGCPESYRDFVRLLHAKYDWSMMDEPMEKLVLRARGAVIVESQPELSYERFRHIEEVRRNIDSQKTLKGKIKYASSHSAFRSDERDTCSVSYVGKVDFGQMADYIRGMYTITDGDMILEVNALPDRFCICLQMADGKRELVDRFCEVMKEEKLPFSISDRQVRRLPAVKLPKAK